MADEFNPEEFEAAIAQTQVTDDFSDSIDYEKFIVLNKKDIADFCKIVEPLTKASVDEYGKSLLISCTNEELVQLTYVNDPYKICVNIPNKSGKTIRSFAVSVNTLKKLLSTAFATVVLVEDENDIKISICSSLLYLETKPLEQSFFNFDKKSTEFSLDKDLVSYTFRKVSTSLSLTERASEKVAVVKGGNIYFNTGVFSSCTKSPFDVTTECVLYKQVSDIITCLSDFSKTGVRYSVIDDTLVLSCDDNYYVECRVAVGERINQFFSPTLTQTLQFDANLSIINDNILNLISTVKNLDYLSNKVKLVFNSDNLQLIISSSNFARTSTYTFPFVSGTPEVTGEFNISVEVLELFLSIVGSDCQYSFNHNGLGIKTEYGTFLIRKA